jgi:hypothetical protein
MALSFAQLDNLTSVLNDAVKAYKESGSAEAHDLDCRRRIAEAAEKIRNATKLPEEQWLDQSVAVRLITSCHQHMELILCRWPSSQQLVVS